MKLVDSFLQALQNAPDSEKRGYLMAHEKNPALLYTESNIKQFLHFESEGVFPAVHKVCVKRHHSVVKSQEPILSDL
jgi:hypothetical protein